MRLPLSCDGNGGGEVGGGGGGGGGGGDISCIGARSSGKRVSPACVVLEW